MRWIPIAALLLLAACASKPPNDFVALGYEAADALVAGAHGELPPESPVVYSVFTPAGEPSVSSPFGRIFAEHVSSGLAHKGLDVVELRLREAIAVREGGPYALSDNFHDVAHRALARAVLVGSYALSHGAPAQSGYFSDFGYYRSAGSTELYYVLITIRLVDASTGVVLSSWDKRVALSRADQALFESQRASPGPASVDLARKADAVP